MRHCEDHHWFHDCRINAPYLIRQESEIPPASYNHSPELVLLCGQHETTPINLELPQSFVGEPMSYVVRIFPDRCINLFQLALAKLYCQFHKSLHMSISLIFDFHTE